MMYLVELPVEVRREMEWLLMVEDAKRNGISAGPTQVNRFLSYLDPQSKLDVESLAAMANVSAGDLTEALEHWLMVQQYRELVLGMSHVSDADAARRRCFGRVRITLCADGRNIRHFSWP